MATMTPYKWVTVLDTTPTGAGGVALNDNFTNLADYLGPSSILTRDPTVNDDINAGYYQWSQIINSTSNTLWICLDNTAGAAVWVSVGAATPPAGGVNEIQYNDNGAFGADSTFIFTSGGVYLVSDARRYYCGADSCGSIFGTSTDGNLNLDSLNLINCKVAINAPNFQTDNDFTGGTNNVVISPNASAQVGGSNVYIGEQSGSASSGDLNVAIGRWTRRGAAGGLGVTIVGAYAGQTFSANGGTMFGYQAGRYANGTRIIAIGELTLSSASGTGIVGVGYRAGDNWTGNNGIVLGFDSARFLNDGLTVYTGGGNCIFIGSNCRSGEQNSVNEIVIGADGRGDGSNTTVIGNTSTTTARIFGTAVLNEVQYVQSQEIHFPLIPANPIRGSKEAESKELVGNIQAYEYAGDAKRGQWFTNIVTGRTIDVSKPLKLGIIFTCLDASPISQTIEFEIEAVLYDSDDPIPTTTQKFPSGALTITGDRMVQSYEWEFDISTLGADTVQIHMYINRDKGSANDTYNGSIWVTGFYGKVSVFNPR